MADNFLYILGAGASRDAVPLVKEFPDSLAIFANELELLPVSPKRFTLGRMPSLTRSRLTKSQN